jgi:hypothetical protein
MNQRDTSHKLVQVNILDDSLGRIESVKRRIHAETMTGAIHFCIAVADMVTAAVTEGANVIIEEKNGNKYRIAILGVNK